MRAGYKQRLMMRQGLAFAMQIVMMLAPLPAPAMTCMPLGSGSLTIGAYQPLHAAALDAQTSIAIECIPAAPGEALNLSVRVPGAGTGRLLLPNLQTGASGMSGASGASGASGTAYLTVQLYRDVARQIPLDDQTVIHVSDRPVVPTRYTVSLFARVPAGQDTGVGHYQLPLTVVIDY